MEGPFLAESSLDGTRGDKIFDKEVIRKLVGESV